MGGSDGGATIYNAYAATLSSAGTIAASTLGTGLVTLNGGGLNDNGAVAGTVLNPVALNGLVQFGYGVTLSGSMTLGSGPPGPVGLFALGGNGNSISPLVVNGVISDSNPAHPNPLVLGSAYWAMTFSPSAGSTYAGGTVVDQTGNGVQSSSNQYGGNYAGITVGASGVLGTGGLTVLPGGRIRLAAATNLASTASISMSSNSVANAVVALAYNAVPNLTSNSSGIIGIDAANSAITTEATLGNGLMFLGTINGGSLTAPTLQPGGGNIYRLGGGGAGMGTGENTLLTVSSTWPTTIQFHEPAGGQRRAGRAGSAALRAASSSPSPTPSRARSTSMARPPTPRSPRAIWRTTPTAQASYRARRRRWRAAAPLAAAPAR